MVLLLALLASAAASTPLEFAKQEIAAAAGSRAGEVELAVRSSLGAESYTIAPRGGKVRIEGGDPVGVMYGAFEFAERVKNDPAGAWSAKAQGKPYLPERGLNLFLTLPWNYAKNDTEYDPAALVDPKRWWFQNDAYWTSLLDLMAHSRLNWLDIHGTWDISVTDAPNLYAYFVTAPSFPKVGVSPEIKAANLAQLNHVIDMAHARGIRVSLMAYQASLRIPQNPNPPYEGTEENVYAYTREAVEQMIRNAPGLDSIGFRIGESGHGGSFFTCYGEAVKNSGRDIPLITRSWVTRRQSVLPLARASKDFTVEIKYNGEHWGAPYMVAGGRVANWYSYSFEDYLSDPGKPETNAKTWPGWPAEAPAEGRWPSEPYKIVWQVRANGTHRIFPFYNPEWVRRSILSMKMGTASGYTIEGEDAYFPKQPDYYMADPSKKGYEWIHQRDAMYWTTWGRLGYDPTVKDEVFDAETARMLGKGSEALVQAWKEASTLLPLAFMAYALGPDHRSHAPELEWGGDTPTFIQGQGFDTHSFLPINEELANAATGGLDGRIGSFATSELLRLRAKRVRATLDQIAVPGGRGPEIANASRLMSDLAEYYAQRLLAAWSMAKVESVSGVAQRSSGDPVDTDAIQWAADASRRLADNPFYKPFTDRLRMHTNTFAWAQETAKVAAESKRILSLPKAVPPISTEDPLRPVRFGKANLEWRVSGGNIVVRLDARGSDAAWLLEKPLPSSTFFHKVPMRRVGDHFEATFPRQKWGHQIAVEIRDGGAVWREPSPAEARPYLVVPSQPGPTPPIYSAEEAMAYLKPEALDPSQYGGMLLGTRAWRFFTSFDKATQRKLLDPIERGMRLVILQQDFNKYKLDWLPKPLKFEGGNWGVFDPGGQLGLSKVETADILWQRFLPSDGWEVFGNGGLARLKLGKGEVWVTSARLMQRMHIPSAAKAFVALLSLGGKTKPTVLIDSNSEGADYSSSNHPDLMNAHDIPFLTLGEVIAREQGMDSATVVPGPTLDDDVLEGKGSAVVAAYQRAKVVQAARRTVPADRPAFQRERARRRAELMRSLGLDPLPSRTPLNARTTGVLQRSGYKIEKVVFESRPKFYVTAHVYVPDAPGKHPVIMNVNGHWAHKKDEDRIQLRCAFQALRGYLAIAIDSPGHSFEGNSLIERRAEGEHNDWFLVQGGLNATGVYVWDAMRALDYVTTRPDADMAHVGLTGASGGGLATLYAFAADDRYQAAVPVVYMASMELAPDNGCLCNHVPGTLQIGDRSDVIAIQAPKPVLLMGAENDGEFPADATRLTGAKMQREWGLFGASGAVTTRIFPGGHDYSKPMREAMIGFFDHALRGVGDGSPVPEPALQALDAEDRSLLVLPDPPSDERTMRELAREALGHPGRYTLADVNGGLPPRSDLRYVETGSGSKRAVVFESEPGLRTPGILLLPKAKVDTVRIVVDDRGKAAAVAEFDGKQRAGEAVLFLDTLGIGELAEVNLRYAIYLGTAVPYTAGWQIARAIEAMKRYGSAFVIEARGPLASMAALDAGLLAPDAARIEASGGLQRWEDVFDTSANPLLVQPRANLLPPLDALRGSVPNAVWRG
ncbi:MAG: acetylxylan esterase [Fimbriimonadaceae bacterium]|nr:acetylxylan esterase [Chthonomonadaceae bacterium]MCO5296245.1 acetylxylan esterase [Fimbriimonadaceae bacterium]